MTMASHTSTHMIIHTFVFLLLLDSLDSDVLAFLPVNLAAEAKQRTVKCRSALGQTRAVPGMNRGVPGMT